ncbi:hypothetical protein NDN08_005483 [Rhodosorus marinus]|uniref:Transcriptional repressor Tup1 N-terminal domain-containing protein n=1 Tax=Rhodosorus marinus TaxID=101924 RepID=A0AAV8V1P2_9RHOD|nr:hypothetical protein NDN08_005483 [Rhodosorus marinus]
MNAQGDAQPGFIEGSALARFDIGRWKEVLDQLKANYEAATQEYGGYGTVAEQYQAKIDAQRAEMNNMEMAVSSLQRKLINAQENYETELGRLRDKLIKAGGDPGAQPASILQIAGLPRAEKQGTETGMVPGSLPALAANFPETQGSLVEPPLKKLRDDGLGGGIDVAGDKKPSLVRGGTLPSVTATTDHSNAAAPLSLPSLTGLGNARLMVSSQVQKEPKTSATESATIIESAPKPVPRSYNSAATSSPENDYTVVHGKELTGNQVNVVLLNTFHHKEVVCCVRYSWDGEYVATGSNRHAYMFNASTGKTYASFSRGDGDDSGDTYVRAMCFSPDGNSLITGSEDKLVKIWDIRKRSVKRKLAGHDGDIYAVESTRDGTIIVSGSADKTAKIWDARSGKILHTLGGAENDVLDGITSISISNNGKYVAAGSLDKTVRVWDVETAQLLCAYSGHTDAVYSVAFSPDCRSLLSGSSDKTLRLWDLSNSNEPKLTFAGHKDFVLSVAFSPNGRLVLSGSKDRTVQFWEPRNARTSLILQGHKNSVISIAHSPTNKMVATGSGDNRARTWAYTN